MRSKLHLSQCTTAIFSALTLSLLLISCGAFDGGDNDRAKRQVEKLEMIGDWESDCVAADWLEVSHQKTKLTFNPNSRFQKRLETYSDADCHKKAATFTLEGKFESLGKNKDEAEATDLNLTIESAALIPRSEMVTSFLNTISYCGIKDWKVGDKRDITNKKCEGEDYEKGKVIYDIYRLKNAKNLSLGKHPGWLTSKSKERPKELDTDLSFKRED